MIIYGLALSDPIKQRIHWALVIKSTANAVIMLLKQWNLLNVITINIIKLLIQWVLLNVIKVNDEMLLIIYNIVGIA